MTQWTDSQKAIWTTIEQNWKALASGDVEKWMESFHPQFSGWSMSHKFPYDINRERSGTEAFLAQWEWTSYDIRPVGISSVDDIAIVHYEYREVLRERDANGHHDEKGRATQVLKNDGGKWKTLTTMSGPVAG